MSKSYKILIAVLSALTLAVISATLWLLLHTPDSAPSSVPGSAAPAPLSASGEIIINEFMEKNRATLRDVDGDFSDWIELYNPSAEALSLSGWHISDKEGVRGFGAAHRLLDIRGRGAVSDGRHGRSSLERALRRLPQGCVHRAQH